MGRLVTADTFSLSFHRFTFVFLEKACLLIYLPALQRESQTCWIWPRAKQKGTRTLQRRPGRHPDSHATDTTVE